MRRPHFLSDRPAKIDRRSYLSTSGAHLSNNHAENFETFMQRAKPNLDRSGGAQIGCIYLKRGDRWINLVATIILGPFQATQNQAPPLVNVNGFKAIHGTIRPDQVQPLLLGIRNNGVAEPEYL